MKSRLVCLILCLSCFTTVPLKGKTLQKPNVLFIAIDDLNDWIGKLKGHPQSLTPHIDRLADRGVLFTNAHCAAPACNPSRAALMTGVAPYRSGIYVNPQPWKAVLKDRVTLSQHFMQNGYRAIASGKIYHGSYPDPESWHDYWPSQTRNRPGDPKATQKSVSGLNKSHFDWGPLDVTDAEMGDTQVEGSPDHCAAILEGVHSPEIVPQAERYGREFETASTTSVVSH